MGKFVRYFPSSPRKKVGDDDNVLWQSVRPQNRLERTWTPEAEDRMINTMLNRVQDPRFTFNLETGRWFFICVGRSQIRAVTGTRSGHPVISVWRRSVVGFGFHCATDTRYTTTDPVQTPLTGWSADAAPEAGQGGREHCYHL